VAYILVWLSSYAVQCLVRHLNYRGRTLSLARRIRWDDVRQRANHIEDISVIERTPQRRTDPPAARPTRPIRAPALASLARVSLLLIALLALLGALGLNVRVAAASALHPASSSITILSQTQTFSYPSKMTFTLQASDSAGSITSAHLVLDVPPEQIHHDITVPVTQPGTQVTLNYTYDASTDYLPPFTPVTYHWVLGDSKQPSPLVGANQQFDFEDTRFTWNHLSQSNITVYWYKQDATFGQQLLTTAVSEATSIEQDLQTTLTTPLRVFTYQSDQDLRGGLPPSTPNWAGGVAFVELYQALIVVGNTQGQPLQRDLPHELTHLIFHEAAGLDCGGCPLWFDEGMAVYHQLYHEADMQTVFDQTVRNNRLLLFNTLSNRFPDDSSLAELAYAQSWQFITYLYKQFGEPKVAKLVNSLGTISFTRAFPAIFGADVAHIESQWHVSLGLPATVSTAPAPTAGTGTNGQNPTTPATSNANELGAGVVLLLTLLLMGAVGGGYLWWRRRQVTAPAAGIGMQGQAPAGPAPNMRPPAAFQPGYSMGESRPLAGPPSSAFQPPAQQLAQVQQALTALLAQEQRLGAQLAQAEAQLARWGTQQPDAQTSSGLGGQRHQLQSYLASLQQQLAQLQLQKQQLLAQQFQAQQQFQPQQQAQQSQAAHYPVPPQAQPAVMPGSSSSVGTDFRGNGYMGGGSSSASQAGAGWAAPAEAPDPSRRRISQE
jgi:hypothetical protein